MTRTKNMTAKLNQIIEKTRTKAEGLREEYAWFFLREAFPTMAEQGLSGLAKFVLGHTGN